MVSQICLIAPNLFGFKGGIQIYSKLLLEDLQTLYPHIPCQVILKYDRPRDLHARPLRSSRQLRFHPLGHWPRQIQTLLMIVMMLWIALRQPHTLMIATHANYAKACYWIKRLIGTPYWVVAHGIEVWNVQHPALRKALLTADRIIAVSHHTRQRLLDELTLSPSQVNVLPNTFDAQRFTIAPKRQRLLQQHGLTPEHKIILTVCRLGKSGTYKGYDQILRALPIIRQTIPQVHYLLVGKGDDTPRIQALIQTLGIESQVTLTGFISDDQLPDYYNLCDVFAMPSRGEGFGIVYLEALACGKPVLAGNQDGAVDPLRHGQLGCLVNPDNSDDIATALIQILQGSNPNPHLYQPYYLRQQAIEQFGRSRFRRTLATLITLGLPNSIRVYASQPGSV